jgi:PAS domain S-box-containing protein
MKTSIRVLYLEDSPRDAELIQDKLDADGLACDVLRVDRREDFEAALSNQTFDLILCDYNLPGYNGLSALKLAQEKHSATPLIMISGSLGEEQAIECLHSGATDYVLKQRLDRLTSSVSRALATSEEQLRRRQAEAALNDSETRLRLVWESALEGMRLTDGEGIVRRVNEAYCRLMRQPRSALEGQPMCAPYAEAKQADALEKHRLRFRERSIPEHLETEITLRDGTEMHLELSNAFVTVPGQPDLVLSIFRDATERKHIEEELRASERKYRDIFTCAPVGLYQSLRDGTIIAANDVLAEILGYASADDLLKVKLGSGVYFNEHEREKLIAGYEDSGKANDHEVRWKRQDGSPIWVELTAHAIKGADGATEYFEGFVRDTTERKRVEEALRASEAQLRQSQKLEAVGQLAGGVAHDFNNLLTAISGYSDLLLQRLPADSPFRAHVTEIKKAGDRAANLTRQLLAFSRKQILEPKVLDLNALITNLEKMLRRLIGEDIDLITIAEPGLGQVKADPGQMEQIVTNLIVNARDAMPTGGKLTVQTTNVVLTEDYAQTHHPVVPGSYVLLAISDTGTGMDAETRQRVFEPFFTTKSAGKGTGLGLSTAYGIVKQSGGYIWAYSEPGQGSTFEVYLPRINAAREAEAAELSAQPLARGTETLLLVEDEEQVRQIAEEILRSAGYEVLVAANGDQALEIAQQRNGKIDLTLTDVVMPRMSGPELISRLSPLRQQMKVLYMSGYTDDAIIRHGLLDKTIEFIQKPFTADALTRKVKAVLDTM